MTPSHRAALEIITSYNDDVRDLLPLVSDKSPAKSTLVAMGIIRTLEAKHIAFAVLDSPEEETAEGVRQWRIQRV